MSDIPDQSSDLTRQRIDCEPQEWVASAQELFDEGYSYFDFLTAVDQTDDSDDPGFDVVLHLYDINTPLLEVFLRTRVSDPASLASLTRIWPGAAWHERETFEMFGIGFDGFTDHTASGLRPLLLPDGFEGTPLRKSFVLAARASKPWPGAKEPGGGSDKPARAGARAPRRRLQPPGVPDESWGPR